MKYFWIGLIKIYQCIPLQMHQLCRHQPTCSQYAIDAIAKYGCIKGWWKAIKRISRCRKHGTSGYDPA